jgi:hypothetical protein
MSARTTLSWKFAEPTTIESVCAGVEPLAELELPEVLELPTLLELGAALGFVGSPLPQAVATTATAARAAPKTALVPLVVLIVLIVLSYVRMLRSGGNRKSVAEARTLSRKIRHL